MLYFPLCVPEAALARWEERCRSETDQVQDDDQDDSPERDQDHSPDRDQDGHRDQAPGRDQDGDQDPGPGSERPLHILWPHRW